MEFGDFDWHDSEIVSINIDRSDPGKNDTIVFDIIWNNNERQKIIFEDVYLADLNLNFGVIANECIDEAYVSEEDKDVQSLYQKWNGKLDGVMLKSYLIRTISTGSEIKIIARAFKVV